MVRMAVLPIVTGGKNPVLRVKTKKVPKVTRDIKKLLKDMTDTMHAADGIGLAAPQVGSQHRVCIATIGGRLTALINPEITWRSTLTDTAEEGCLSLPNVWMDVTRPTEIDIKYWNEEGQEEERHLVYMDARVVQHEVDHLDGILIIDHVKKPPVASHVHDAKRLA